MKYSEIDRYIMCDSTATCFELKYFVNHIKEELKEGLILNPDFQRGHVWTEQQQIAYVEFLLRGGRSGREFYFNCPTWPCVSDDGNYVCVDGLQRITAILKFMNNEIPAFGTLYKDFEDKLPRDIVVFIYVNKLQTKKEVLQWYIEMNSGGTPHTKEEIQRVKELMNSI